MNSNFKSNLLVALQFILIGLLLWGTPKYNFSIGAVAFIFMAIFLILWAIIVMRKSKLRISPIPAADALLITEGPYKYIRHPMYTAIFMGVTGLLIIYFTWMRLVMAIALAVVLLIKMSWEEKMLSMKFITYKNYIAHSKKIIPYLF